MKTAPGLAAAILAAVPALATNLPDSDANAHAPTATFEIALARVSQMESPQPTFDEGVEDVGAIVLSTTSTPGDDPTQAIVAVLSAAYGKLSVSTSPTTYSYVYNPETGQWELVCRNHTQIEVPIPAGDPVRVTIFRRMTLG